MCYSIVHYIMFYYYIILYIIISYYIISYDIILCYIILSMTRRGQTGETPEGPVLQSPTLPFLPNLARRSGAGPTFFCLVGGRRLTSEGFPGHPGDGKVDEHSSEAPEPQDIKLVESLKSASPIQDVSPRGRRRELLESLRYRGRAAAAERRAALGTPAPPPPLLCAPLSLPFPRSLATSQPSQAVKPSCQVSQQDG